MQLRAIRILLITATAVLAWTTAAQAYPQFQFSTDNARCTMCHFSPSGGGLVNAWGREEAADTISRGGDGAFLGGAWEPPEWLALGADLRAATGLKDTPAEGIDTLLFPMQADVYSRAEFGPITLTLTLGLRKQARDRNPPPQAYIASREHYVMYQPESTGLYVRAGRFYAPYGLRQVDHTNYIRRDLGFYTDEQTYGVSGGYLKGNEWELHLSAFTRDPLFAVGPAGSGLAALYEKRFNDDAAAWGVQSKVQLGPDSHTYWAGGTFKYWLPSLDLLVLTELDIGVQRVDTPNADPIAKGIAHLNLTHFITTGLMVGTTLEAKHGDLSLRGKDAEAATLSLQYFPRAHYEIMVLAKAERTRNTSDLLSLLMLHYYL
tara:strand:- start:18320 stop:19447 length:1128 start_codon:yes stop_codon:yes gene_type:complete